MPKSIVPKDHQWLHEMFMDYRGNFIGHANFKTMKPVIGLADKARYIPISYLSISFDHWFKLDEEFPETGLLIDEAIELTRKLVSEIYPERDHDAS